MAEYQRRTFRWQSGVNVTVAVDTVAPGELAFGKNVRSYQLGTIQPRPGETAINSSAIADTTIHSVRRLNDDTPSASRAFSRYLGAGTNFYTDDAAHTAFSVPTNGGSFGGTPLSLVPARPDQSPRSYLYVTDATKSGKISSGATVLNRHGIVPPNTEPGVTFDVLGLNNIQNFNSAAALTAAGTAGAPATQARVATTIAQILFDTGTTGWATVNPTTPTANITPGFRITINTGGGTVEQVTVDSTYKAITTTTIAAITYDTGTSGLCTVTLTATPSEGLVPNAFIRIAAAENCRVLSIIDGPSGARAFRTSTTATRAAGDAVVGLNAFRAYCLNTHAAAEPLDATGVRSTITAGVGTITQTISIDLSVIGNRPTNPDDFLHVSVKLDNIANLTEMKLALDCDSTTNDFTRNYFYVAARANDFVPAVAGSITQLTAKQRKLQRNLIDTQGIIQRLEGLPPTQRRADKLAEQRAEAKRLKRRLKDLDTSPAGGPDQSSDETTTGASQWTEFRFRLRDLQRVGPDESRGLKDIKAWQLSFNVTASTVVDMDDLYFAGGYGPDVGSLGTPYIYRYRYRSSTTGARSYPSPPLRSGIQPHRQAVTLTPTVSTDTQVDKIDWYRFGGALDIWKYIGTQANSGTLVDELPDDTVASYPDLEPFGSIHQPFVVTDTPRTMTVNITGSAVTRTAGDTFNTAWAEGTEIIINGTLCTLYGSPVSTSFAYINESMGTLSAVTAFLPEPAIYGQPLPSLWGPFGQGVFGTFLFACGDAYNPGFLYWTNGNDPDSTANTNFLEVTSPSEPLMNGCIYGSRSMVFSSEQLYEIYPSLGGNTQFTAQATPCGYGLAGRYALAVGKYVYFVAKDGIYRTTGGRAESITDAKLYPLFPHDGQAGTSTNGIIAPDFTSPNNLRLSCGDETLRFEYLGLDGNRYSLVYSEDRNTWDWDSYGRAVVTSYYEEGRGVHQWLLAANNGKLYTHSGTSDDTIAIAAEARSGSFDMGDGRAAWLFGDVLVDYNPAGVTIAAQVGFDNYTVLPTPTNLTSTTGRRQFIVDVNSGSGTFARNVALDLSWSSASATPVLYFWQPSYLPQPESIQRRRTDFDSAGYDGPKFFQGIRITADTSNVAKSVLIQGDNGTNGLITTEITLSITHNGQSTIDYPFDAPFIAHNVRLLPNDATAWELFGVQWLYQPDSPLVTYWETQTITQFEGYGHERDGFIAHVSTADITLTLVLDGTSYVYTIAHGSGAFAKTYVPFQAIKHRSVKYKLSSSAPFRLYKKMCEVRVGQWGRSGPYLVTNPFGEYSDADGARI